MSRYGESVLAVLLLLLCKILVCLAAISAPDCQDTSYGRTCSLHAPVESLNMLEDRLMVGSSNALFSFTMDLHADTHVDLSPDAATHDHCVGFDPGQFGNPPSLCKNFVKLIQVVPGDERILVCGTNAFRPKCTLHNILDISSYEYMTDQNHVDKGFSPYSNDTQIIATLTSNGRFFSGTRFDVFSAPQTMGMAPNPLQGDNAFTVQVPSSDQRWLRQPTFVSSCETDQHIYFFLREPAYEIDEGESVVYSRAIRICKSDDGVTANDPNNFFQTFQKARIVCTSSEEQGSLPYAYDNLQSTFLWVEPDGQQFLYGVFTSPVNAPSGSAICKFSFDSNTAGTLTSVFEDGNYYVPDGNPPTWSLQDSIDPFSCPGEAGTQRSFDDADQYQLVFNHVTSMDSQPVHTVLGKRLAKIAIDAISYNGSVQNILYFSTMQGDIHQLVIDAQERRQEKVISYAGAALGHLTVHKNADETRSLYATTENRIMSISLGDCPSYGNCFACLDSKDAYCGWDNDSKMCVNKITSDAPNLLQSVLTSESEIVGVCGERTATQPLPCPTNTPTTEEAACTNDCTVNTGGLTPEAQSSVSIPDLVGATVGAFVVGIPVGAFVCFIFLRLFIAPRRHKHAINRQHRSSQDSTVTQVNNRLNDDQPQQKKDFALKENQRYVHTTPIAPPPIEQKPSPLTLAPPPTGNTHKRTNSKDINTFVAPEDDETFDEVPPLRSISSTGTYPHRGHKPNGHGHANGVQRKRVPGYKVPRGRTDSTTWLRQNSESSEPASPMSPLDSPISDV